MAKDEPIQVAKHVIDPAPPKPAVTYDKPGYCALCHTEIAEFNGSNEQGNPIIVRLKGNYRSSHFRLDNGSLMPVTLCENCEDLKPEQYGELMESIINGWKNQLDTLPLEFEKKDEFYKKHSKLFVTDRADKRLSDSDIKKITKPDPRKLEKLVHQPSDKKDEKDKTDNKSVGG